MPLPKELSDPKCNPKMLLKKYLTEDVYNSLKDKKTASGFTLGDLINSGLQNLDSSNGVYAGDEESYTLFADLLNPMIITEQQK